MEALSVIDLDVRYGNVKAVQGISLSLPVGGFHVILGANGAGKSSVIRSVMGLVKPAHGAIRLFANEMRLPFRPDQANRMGVAWVPEGREVFTTLTVRENLLMGCFRVSDREVINGRLKRMYEMFPILEERKDHTAGALSGGEQQMLAFGRGLMSEPKILLLDEPSLGLAPKLVRQVFDTVATIRDQGVSVLMAEQNARQALRVADFGYLMEVGTVKISGAASDLMNDKEVQRAYLGG